jgi:hypothetical protein
VASGTSGGTVTDDRERLLRKHRAELDAWWAEQVEASEVEELHSCGHPEGSFACKIRHIHMNTGAAKAAND